MTKTRFRKIFRGDRQLPLAPADAPAEPNPAATEPSATPSPAAGGAETAATAAGRELSDYLRSAVLLRDSGRFDEAEDLLAEAGRNFPGDPRPRIDWAIVAHARRDWVQAVRRWLIVRAEFPSEPVGYALGGRALRLAGRNEEAESLLEAARRQFPDDGAVALEYAQLAAESTDRSEAAARWQLVRRSFPETIESYIALPPILRALGDTRGAEEILGEGADRFPGSALLVFDFAGAAATRLDWPAALERWSIARAAFPDRVDGYLGSAAALRELGRIEEAETLLAEAIDRFPTDRHPRIEWARAAQSRGDWEQADQRWREARGLFPEASIAFTLGADALRHSGALEEAEVLLGEARERFPNDPGVANQSAWLATHRQDWPEALRRWEDVRSRFPDRADGYIGVALVLRQTQRLDEADAVLAEADARFPGNRAVHIEAARVAEHQNDWPEAARRWELMRDRLPDDREGYLSGARALLAAGQREHARTLLTEALRRFPDDAVVKASRAELGGTDQRMETEWGASMRLTVE